MVSVLQNTTALAASRQLGLTKLGLGRSIERLTTHKRINRASDDASGMVLGNAAEAAARAAGASVIGFQIIYFTAQAWDATLEEATNTAFRMAELEGGSNASSEEYIRLQLGHGPPHAGRIRNPPPRERAPIRGPHTSQWCDCPG